MGAHRPWQVKREQCGPHQPAPQQWGVGALACTVPLLAAWAGLGASFPLDLSGRSSEQQKAIELAKVALWCLTGATAGGSGCGRHREPSVPALPRPPTAGSPSELPEDSRPPPHINCLLSPPQHLRSCPLEDQSEKESGEWRLGPSSPELGSVCQALQDDGEKARSCRDPGCWAETPAPGRKPPGKLQGRAMEGTAPREAVP